MSPDKRMTVPVSLHNLRRLQDLAERTGKSVFEIVAALCDTIEDGRVRK